MSSCRPRSTFPHTGKLLSLSFILFAGWFAGAPVPVTEYPRLALTGLLTFFGSLNAAVPFLLDLFRIPADTFQLFVATGVINSRFGTLTAAVHTIVVALHRQRGRGRHDAIRAASGSMRYLVITGVLIVADGRWAARDVPDAAAAGVQGRGHRVRHDQPSRTRSDPGGAAVCRRRARAPVLRRAFARAAPCACASQQPRLPFVFRNGRGDLVGFDIELAHLLARDLGVKVEFAEWPSGELVRAVTAGRCDMGIGGTPVTPTLAHADTVFRAVHRRNARLRRQGPSEEPVRDVGVDSGDQGHHHRRAAVAVLRAGVASALARGADARVSTSRRIRCPTVKALTRSPCPPSAAP